jgi:T4-like virus tail tube protein gp19
MAAARRSVSIVVYNAAGKPTAKFWLANGWPIKLQADMEGASTTDGTPVVEDVTLSGEYVTRVAP